MKDLDKAYISYSIDTEVLFDDEGEEVQGDEYWLISKLYVPAGERGQGKARRMLEQAIKDMHQERPDLDIKLWCEAQDSDTDTEMLQGFYESVGFTATGIGAEMVI